VIAQKNRPLAGLGNIRRLLHDLDDRVAVFLSDRHVNPRHQRKVIGHVAFIAVAEVLAHILRPLIRFRQQETVPVGGIDGRAQLLDHGVRLAQVFVAGTLALDQIGNGIQAKTVDAHIEPEAHDLQHGLHDLRIVEIQVRLMAEEAMPVVGLGDRIPGPVGVFRVGKDDARAEIFLVGVAPYVEIALRRAWR